MQYWSALTAFFRRLLRQETVEPAESPVELPGTGELRPAAVATPQPGRDETSPASNGPPPTVESLSGVEHVPCAATIRRDLGTINIRSGPGLTFARLHRAKGGMRFGVAGASGPDPDGFPWYWIEWNGGMGWVRSDLVHLEGDCEPVVRRAPVGVEPVAAPLSDEPDDRFSLPTPHTLTQDFHNSHPGYDIGAPDGSPFRASAPGIVIRQMSCARCTDAQPNISPASLTGSQRDALYNDADWGFGYGNFIIVRYGYADLPASFRRRLSDMGLSGGSTYVMYAHLSRTDVTLNERVDASTILGVTGSTGLVAGPSLHLEVRVGREETVDGKWIQQTVMPPNSLFRVSAVHK